MRVRKIIFLLTIFLLGKGFAYNIKAQANGRWSGTVSEHSQVTGKPGIEAESMVTINYNNNVGTGTYSKTDILTIDGKLMGRTNCSGNGTVGFAELSIDNDNKTYTIQTSALIYTCTYLRDSPDSGECYITIDNKPWDGNARVLKGSIMQVTDIPGGGKLTTTTTWDLVKESDVELIVTPQKYDTWVPIPGKDEQTPGPEMMSVTLELQDKKNHRPASEKAKEFRLRLSNTSKEKGITINMPLVPAAQQLPDLRFQPQQGAIVTQEGQEMIISCPAGCLTANFKIASYDGGGWTTMTAVAVLETDSIKGELLKPGGEEDILIPKRKSGSKIATAWLDKNNSPGETDDEETSSGKTNGDGLSAYEEYRGVISEEKFKRLDPQKKEMGVLLKKADLTSSIFNPGMSLFENATDIKVIRFIENEIGTDRRLNKNDGTAHIYDQYVQKLEKGTCADSASGENRPINVLSKTPALSDLVVIDVNRIIKNYNAQVAQLAAANRRFGTALKMPYTQTEDIANTVAHELAHGVGVDHHGFPSDVPNKTIPPANQTVDIFHIYGSDGVEITDRPFPIPGSIGTKGNDASGDLSCIMAYTSFYQWAYRVGSDGSLNYYAIPLLPVGKKLCTSNTCPACINANDKFFGESGNGNCASHVKLK